MENGPFEDLLNMGIFHCYVSLPRVNHVLATPNLSECFSTHSARFKCMSLVFSIPDAPNVGNIYLHGR